MKAVIGLSLSFCIKDIIEGRVAEESVACLIVGTKAENADQWQGLVNDYARLYWQSDPERAMRIADRLYIQGRIVQPRVFGREAYNIAAGHWLVQSFVGEFVQTRA